MVYKRRHQLPSVAYVDGGNIQIPLSGLPPLHRIEAFVITLEALFTTGAAAAAIASTQLHRLINMLDIGPQIRGDGLFWHFLEWQMFGRENALPAGLPAANNESDRRNIVWTVPFLDPRSRNPEDECPIGADFAEKVISIDTNLATGLGVGTWSTLASVAGTVRVEALLLPPNGKPGAMVQFGTADLTGQSPDIKGTALYEDLFLYRTTAGTVDSAQVATVALQGDGNQLTDQIRYQQYVTRFNTLWSKGSTAQTASATVPQGGEYLPEQPAVASGSAATITGPFLPILYPLKPYKKANMPFVEQVLKADFTGTDTTYRVGYRRVLPWTDQAIASAFARMGRSAPKVKSVTGNGGHTPASTGLARYLPLQAA